MIRKPFGKASDAGGLGYSDHDIRPMRRKSLGSHPATSGNTMSPQQKPPSTPRASLASRFIKKDQSPKVWESKGNLLPREQEQYMVEAQSKQNEIVQFDGMGNILDTIQLTSEIRNPQDMAVDSQNNIYVVDSSLHTITKFDSQGDQLM